MLSQALPRDENRMYQVLVLPRRAVIARHLSLREACSFIRAYNQAMAPGPQRAVIAEGESDQKAA